MSEMLTTKVLGPTTSIELDFVPRMLTPFTATVPVSFCRRFESDVLQRAKATYLSRTVLTAYPVMGDFSDDDIIASLPDGYFFSEWEVCARLQQLAELQPRDVEGYLIPGERPNLFYLRDSVVEMKNRFAKGWHASVYPKNELPWDKWTQVVSRTPPTC
ncbi:MAG: hypothetical protein AAB472_01755 [Patescibacteria group bacterium]